MAPSSTLTMPSTVARATITRPPGTTTGPCGIRTGSTSRLSRGLATPGTSATRAAGTVTTDRVRLPRIVVTGRPHSGGCRRAPRHPGGPSGLGAPVDRRAACPAPDRRPLLDLLGDGGRRRVEVPPADRARSVLEPVP